MKPGYPLYPLYTHNISGKPTLAHGFSLKVQQMGAGCDGKAGRLVRTEPWQFDLESSPDKMGVPKMGISPKMVGL